MNYHITTTLLFGSGLNHRIWNQDSRTQILKNITMHGDLLLAQGEVFVGYDGVSVLIFSPVVSSFRADLVSAASKA